MRRAVASLSFLVFAATVLAAPDWQPATVEMPIKQAGPHSWYVQGRLEDSSTANQGFMSNAGFVITRDCVVVFDALGTPALAARLIEAIRQRTPLPICRVIISHYHADHFYGIPALRAAGAAIWAQAGARAYLQSDAAQARLQERQASLGRWLGPAFTLPLPDRWLSADESFALGGLHFILKHVGPGHAPEDLAMLVEEDGVLFGGDTVYAGRVPFIGEADVVRWLEALDRLAQIPARVLVPGHGPATLDPQADLAITRRYLEFLRAQMAQAVADFLTFDEAYARIDWQAFAGLPTFKVANRANAYNVFLQMEQAALRH